MKHKIQIQDLAHKRFSRKCALVSLQLKAEGERSLQCVNEWLFCPHVFPHFFLKDYDLLLGSQPLLDLTLLRMALVGLIHHSLIHSVMHMTVTEGQELNWTLGRQR